MNISSRIWAVLAGVGVAGFVALLAFGGGDGTDGTTSLLGRRVPEVIGETLDLDEPDTPTGVEFDIDDHRGRWVLVNFFATWCPPCIAEHPELVALEEWGDETGELEVVSVVFNDDPGAVAEFFDERGGDWPVLSEASIAVEFQIAQIPESFLVDPSGVVVAHFISGIEASEVLDAMGVAS
ncbi:MAG: TlpA family protein disulfide reductase [Acidimicrobiales bacterium]